jgi:thioredoxin 1
MGEKTFEVSESTFQSDVLDSSLPVLVDFWADWCQPCKMIAPFVEQIAKDYEGKLRVAKLDADANPDIMIQYGVMGLPTLLLFKDGEPVERITGFQPKDRITKQLEGHLN